MSLPSSAQHRFTPEIEPRELEVIEPLLQKLDDMPVNTPEELATFLAAWDETERWIGEHIKQAQVATQVNTEDEEAQAHWMHLVGNVIPPLSVWDDRLNRKLLDAPGLKGFQEKTYTPFITQTRKTVELFREENIPLQRELNELTNEYNKISGAWRIPFRGEEYTMSGMRRFTMSPDRETRKEAWTAVNTTLHADSDKLDTLWEKMFTLRQQVANNAGFDNFRDYIFAAKQRDYDPEACYAYHEVIEKEVVPLAREIAASTKDKLGVDDYRPWDTSADPDGGEPLNPFSEASELQEGVERMMRRLDPELGEQFHLIREFQDLESRKGKSQGGFMMTFPWAKRPFIFANASGVHSDIVTLLHEAGHAFHFLAAVDNNPMAGTSVPMEFNEVASMAMELLHYDTLDEFYSEEERKRAIHEHLRRIPNLLVSVARGDAWQQWLYTHLDHTRAERHEQWVEMSERFSTGVDWTGLNEDWRRSSWHAVLHFFVVPFYYIEYGFAQLGALQVAVNADKDHATALESYKQALALGPQRDTAGLYAAAGADFTPSAEKVRELMDWVRVGLGL